MEAKKNKARRKVFLSILGMGQYKPCTYYNKRNDYKGSESVYIQQSTLDMLTCKKGCEWTENDVCYIILTNGAKRKNWEDDGYLNFSTKEKECNVGLEKTLKSMNMPCQLKTITIPDGNTETEIFEIFNTIYSQLQADDAIYFDITHSFRYLPMLVLVLCNYSKFMKGVEVKSITYGNWENRNKETNEAEIVDLLSLSQLQDWSYAAGNFLENGNVVQLVELSGKATSLMRKEFGTTDGVNAVNNLIKKLELVVNDLRLCRGKNIYNNKEIDILKDQLQTIHKSMILENKVSSPLLPVIEKVASSFTSFSKGKENVKNGFAAAQWCLEHKLEQQCLTILQENIITFLCVLKGIDIEAIVERELVSCAIQINHLNIKRKDWTIPNLSKSESSLSIREQEHIKEERSKLLVSLVEMPELQKVANLASKIKDLRNDINHAGMRPGPITSGKIRKTIVKYIHKANEQIDYKLLDVL